MKMREKKKKNENRRTHTNTKQKRGMDDYEDTSANPLKVKTENEKIQSNVK
jgi:hypothetical protein